MWGTFVETFSTIVFFIFLSLSVYFKKAQKKWIICMIIFGGISVYSSFYPVENLFYSFSSPEAVADYSCDGEIIKIIDGTESSLILYSDLTNNVSYMLSNRTADGYKIGNHGGRDQYTVLHPQVPIRIIESANAKDKYVYAFGVVTGHDLSICDTQNNQFYVFNQTVKDLGSEVIFYAFYLMNSPSAEFYEINVESSQELVRVSMELNEKGRFSMIEGEEDNGTVDVQKENPAEAVAFG